MKIYRIPLYDKFICQKGSCSVPCCHGWQIPIDPQSYKKYKSTKGKLGLSLFFAMSGGKELPVFNGSAMDCHFYTKDGLCGLQQQMGEDFIPGICRRFPRKKKNYGPFAEESLELACPYAATLFCENHSALSYQEFDEEIDYPDTSTNDDYKYLEELLLVREKMISYLMKSDTSLWDSLLYIRSYAHALQDQCATGIADIVSVSFPTELSEEESIVFDLDLTDRLMCSGIYHVHFKKRLPLLYEICRYYFDTFDSMGTQDGDAYLSELTKQYLTDHPETEEFLRDYFVYYLQTNFLSTFEDYSFLRVITFGMMHVHFLLLFFALYEKHTENTQFDYAPIIASYERHVRHNDTLQNDLWEHLQELTIIAP